jgi:hypothetical protein
MSWLNSLMQVFRGKEQPVRRMEIVKRDPIIAPCESVDERDKRLRYEAAAERMRVQSQWIEQCEVNFDESKSKSYVDAPVYMHLLEVRLNTLAENKAFRRHWNKDTLGGYREQKSA